MKRKFVLRWISVGHAVARLLFVLPALVLAVLLLVGGSTVVIAADSKAEIHAVRSDFIVTRHSINKSGDSGIRRVSLMSAVPLSRVSLASMQRIFSSSVFHARSVHAGVLNHTMLRDTAFAGRTSDFKELGHRELISEVVVEHYMGKLIVTGWRDVQLKVQSPGRRQSIFLQEVRITMPATAANGGWDVRALERELERLGVKRKPKPTQKPPQSRPIQQLSG